LFHKECLLSQYKVAQGEFLKCAVCETAYGVRTGEMPNGKMQWRLVTTSLPGFEGHGTIEFWYNFDDGYLPNGQRYTGTYRRAYVPASPEGIIVFKKLVVAFDRRLSFSVGTSLTTGLTNAVVWAGVHHKTSKYAGPFGYPDVTYLGRVTEELKARNIEEDAIRPL
jgi:deltex-like protein